MTRWRWPQVKCDHCPSVWHADCLEPPLTAAPTSSWMCPLHPDPVAEAKLLPPAPLLTQRLALHRALHARKLDHLTVQLDFVRKAAAERASSAAGVDPSLPRMRVPEDVKRA